MCIEGTTSGKLPTGKVRTALTMSSFASVSETGVPNFSKYHLLASSSVNPIAFYFYK
jgi:hypothetical protein